MKNSNMMSFEHSANRVQCSTTQVLIVEDSAFERMRLAKMLGDFGYHTHLAEDGDQALAVMERVTIDIVLSDWSMPGMDGLELCARVTSEERFSHPYFIMLTGRSEPGDLVQGMEAGADDFIAKPVASDELRVRLNSGLRLLESRHLLEQQNEAITQTLERERHLLQSLQQDIDAAAQMQIDYLPRDLAVDGIDYGYIFEPASGVSGDALGLHLLDSDHIGFFLLDVCGHGIASGMHAMSIARRMTPFLKQDSLLYDEFEQIQAPHRVVSHLNEIYCRNELPAHLVTLAYGVMNFRTGRGQLCLAGHPQALFNVPGEDCVVLGKPNLPIGVKSDAKYESSYFTLPANASLMLYSDGLIERGQTGRQRDVYESELIDAFSQLDDLPAVQICKKLEKWLHASSSEDDVSALIIKLLADG